MYIYVLRLDDCLLSLNLEFIFNSLSITDVEMDQWLWSTYIQVNGMLPEWLPKSCWHVNNFICDKTGI